MAAEAIKARVTSPPVKLPLARRGLGVTHPGRHEVIRNMVTLNENLTRWA
jgi:hypothetical protein